MTYSSLDFYSLEHIEKLGFLEDVEIEFQTACEMMSKMLTNDATVAESLCIFASLFVTCKCHCVQVMDGWRPQK